MTSLLQEKVITILSADQCADLLMDTVPLVMRAVRAEMRRQRPLDLSVMQFRALGFVRRNPGASLSHVAAHLGLTLPTVSKMVDGLVERQLIVREADTEDRRRITLRLSVTGQDAVTAAHRATQRQIAAQLAPLTSEQRGAVANAMRTLRPLFNTDELDVLEDAENIKEE